MANVNKVIIAGRLGRDPDKRFMPNSTPVTTIAVATSEKWKDRETGEQKEHTEWHQVVFFGRQAEVASDYLAKGSRVLVEGKIRTEKYTDKNGIERYTTKIMADRLEFLDSKAEAQQQSAQSYAAVKGKQQNSQQNSQQPAFINDDIPF